MHIEQGERVGVGTCMGEGNVHGKKHSGKSSVTSTTSV